MKTCDVNKRHQMFKRELRAYHDSINRTNRYNLAKIAGKLNVFESDADDGEITYIVDRKIPNSGLTVLKMNDLYAIGDIDGNPLTGFKYQFIEGCLGKHDKIVRCITDEGDIEDFSVETETVVEDAAAGGGDVSGLGTGDVGCGGGHKDYSEIDYSDVKEQLTIPYLCGARVVDIRNGVGRHRRRKRGAKGRR